MVPLFPGPCHIPPGASLFLVCTVGPLRTCQAAGRWGRLLVLGRRARRQLQLTRSARRVALPLRSLWASGTAGAPNLRSLKRGRRLASRRLPPDPQPGRRAAFPPSAAHVVVEHASPPRPPDCQACRRVHQCSVNVCRARGSTGQSLTPWNPDKDGVREAQRG